MNSKQLQYFLVTAEQGSITAAARHLDVAQPAISLQLANLEHELKAKLFERDFRGVELTEQGKKFEKHAQLIMGQMQAAKSDLAGDQSEYKGKVVLGLSQSNCNVLSMPLLQELEHRFANIELVFRIGPSFKVEKWLAEGTVDLALCFTPMNINTSSKALPIIEEDLFLYISKQPQNPSYSELALYSNLPFSDLQHYEIFVPEQQDALTQLLQLEAQKLGIKLKSKRGFGQLMTTLHYVTQGVGLIICPSSATFHLEQSGQIRPINMIEPNLNRMVYLQMAEQKQNNNIVKAIFELVREVSADTHAKQHWRGKLLDEKYRRTESNNVTDLLDKQTEIYSI